MSSLLARLKAIVARWWPFSKGPTSEIPVTVPLMLPAPDPEPSPPPVMVEQPTPRVTTAPLPADDEQGAFYFRETILDQLDRYFRLMRRMRDGDREAYDLHSKIGAFVVPRKVWHGFEHFNPQGMPELQPIWRTTRPTFGAVMLGATPEHAKLDIAKDWLPAAIYFRKYAPAGVPAEVQPARGDIYAVTVYWDKITPGGNRHERRARRTGAPTEFPVVIDATGRVGLLKTRITDEVLVRQKKRGKGRGKQFPVPRRQWRHDDFFVEWAASKQAKVDAYLTALFIDAANIITDAAMSAIRVRVQCDTLAACFAVNMLRTPYFFRDRDAVMTAGGTKKPIFHIVRTHERQYASGRQSLVRTHFRGERRFKWNGYDVEISVPYRDHSALFDVDFGAYDSSRVESPDRMVDMRGLGNALRKHEKAQLRC